MISYGMNLLNLTNLAPHLSEFERVKRVISRLTRVLTRVISLVTRMTIQTHNPDFRIRRGLCGQIQVRLSTSGADCKVTLRIQIIRILMIIRFL